jgi:hypothetical protein
VKGQYTGVGSVYPHGPASSPRRSTCTEKSKQAGIPAGGLKVPCRTGDNRGSCV